MTDSQMHEPCQSASSAVRGALVLVVEGTEQIGVTGIPEPRNRRRALAR